MDAGHLERRQEPTALRPDLVLERDRHPDRLDRHDSPALSGGPVLAENGILQGIERDTCRAKISLGMGLVARGDYYNLASDSALYVDVEFSWAGNCQSQLYLAATDYHSPHVLGLQCWIDFARFASAMAFPVKSEKGASFVNYGFTWKDKGMAWKKVGKSFLLAVMVIFWAYLTLAFSDWVFKTDYRIWVFAIKPMSFFHFKIVLTYLIPFAFYFLIAGLVLHGELRRGQKDGSDSAGWKEMVVNVLLMIGGYALFLAYQYTPLFSGGTAAVTTRWAPSIRSSCSNSFRFLRLWRWSLLISTARRVMFLWAHS